MLDIAQAIVEKYELSPCGTTRIACALKDKVRGIISDGTEPDRVKEIKRVPLRKAAR